MKRFAAILSALMILVATTGVPMVTHHCMVKGQNTWITTATDYECCGDEEGMMKGCCSNEFELNKVDDSFLSYNLTSDLLPEFVVAIAKTYFVDNVSFTDTTSILPANDADPPPCRDNIRILLQVFLL